MSDRRSCCGGGRTAASPPADAEGLVDAVREHYAEVARSAPAKGASGSCCGDAASADDAARAIGYADADLDVIPEGANLGLGCGAPVGHLGLQPGETVLDLGSGGGIDAFIAARAVGPQGQVIGVDMTPEMLSRARATAERLGLTHVSFREGRLEALPVADASVDAVTSNCVINLVPDKGAVFREVHRVLRPGGRLVVSDVILDGELPEALSQDVLSYVGCVAGAMRREPYFALLADAGLTEITVLRDVDVLAGDPFGWRDEASGYLDAAGIDPESLVGKVRSITYRATKPAS